jgi:hypothetical protein
MDVVLSKVPGWAFAWSLGWLVFWLTVFIFLFILIVIQGDAGQEDFLNFLVILVSGGIGGFVGGLVAGLFTMLALRPNAPSITWKHMSPTIRIWAVSGPLGMVASGVIVSLMLATGAIAIQSASPDCSGLNFNECVGQIFGGDRQCDRAYPRHRAGIPGLRCDGMVPYGIVRRPAGSPSHPQAGAGHHEPPKPERVSGLGLRGACRGGCNDGSNRDIGKHAGAVINKTSDE